MSAHLDLEQIEDLALRDGTHPHLAECAECAQELAWARTERAMLTRRAQPDTSRLWAGVDARVQARKVVPFRRRFAVGAAAALSAAAALLVVVQRPHGPLTTPPDAAVVMEDDDAPVVDHKALAALDRAETDVKKAATQLEAEYQTARAKMDPTEAKKWDATLAKARAPLGSAQAVAALDVQARMRLIDGYSGYLRSLRDVVASAGSRE